MHHTRPYLLGRDVAPGGRGSGISVRQPPFFKLPRQRQGVLKSKPVHKLSPATQACISFRRRSSRAGGRGSGIPPAAAPSFRGARKESLAGISARWWIGRDLNPRHIRTGGIPCSLTNWATDPYVKSGDDVPLEFTGLPRPLFDFSGPRPACSQWQG